MEKTKGEKSWIFILNNQRKEKESREKEKKKQNKQRYPHNYFF